jgi:hypothetical protein
MTKKWMVLLVCFFLLAGLTAADFVTISPIEFDDDDDDANARNCDIWGEYIYDSGGVWHLAAVNLPHGAVIRNMRVCYYDNHAQDIWINFYRINKFTGTQEYIFQTTTTGAVAGIRSVVDSTCSPASLRGVQNNTCSYFVALGFNAQSSGLRIHGITIEYD